MTDTTSDTEQPDRQCKESPIERLRAATDDLAKAIDLVHRAEADAESADEKIEAASRTLADADLEAFQGNAGADKTLAKAKAEYRSAVEEAEIIRSRPDRVRSLLTAKIEAVASAIDAVTADHHRNRDAALGSIDRRIAKLLNDQLAPLVAQRTRMASMSAPAATMPTRPDWQAPDRPAGNHEVHGAGYHVGVRFDPDHLFDCVSDGTVKVQKPSDSEKDLANTRDLIESASAALSRARAAARPKPKATTEQHARKTANSHPVAGDAEATA